jgi:hypothetical protein
LVRAVRQRYCYENKSFLVLFFKKELLAVFLLARRGYGSTVKAADITEEMGETLFLGSVTQRT